MGAFDPERLRGGGRWWVLAALVACALIVALVVWWQRRGEVPVEGEIDEDALSRPFALCVRGYDAPCRAPEDVERALEHPALEVVGAEGDIGSNQGVVTLAVERPGGPRLKVKWRAIGTESLFTHPANELGAHALQTLLLDPPDYVVPPVTGRCFDVAQMRRFVPGAAPLAGTSCVFGVASYWLSSAITLPEARRQGVLEMPPDGPRDDDPRLYDAARFERDPLYRRNLAILNLITDLVNNRDAHAGQFVLYVEPWHLFLVDSSLAFRTLPNPTTFFIEDLSRWVVPAIPADVAARLRALDRRALDALLVLEEHARRDGRWVEVEPGAPFDVRQRFRRDPGRIQIGLSPADVDGVWRRIEDVRAALDDGTLGTF